MTDGPDAISPAVALARMALAGRSTEEIASSLPAGSAIASLFDRHQAGLDTLITMLRESGVDHRHGSLNEIRRWFDRAVERAPEASVAAYSLNDPGLLGQATDELVAWMRSQGLIGLDSDVLDVGCGIGRVAAALAPLVHSVVATDVSTAMIEEARRRSSFPNLRFAVTDGVSLPSLPAGLDLIVFVDSMPYLIQAGIADRQVEQSARMLRPGGALLVLNLDYSGDPDEVARGWSGRLGLRLVSCGERPFRLWDGAAYIFTKQA